MPHAADPPHQRTQAAIVPNMAPVAQQRLKFPLAYQSSASVSSRLPPSATSSRRPARGLPGYLSLRSSPTERTGVDLILAALTKRFSERKQCYGGLRASLTDRYYRGLFADLPLN